MIKGNCYIRPFIKFLNKWTLYFMCRSKLCFIVCIWNSKDNFWLINLQRCILSVIWQSMKCTWENKWYETKWNTNPLDSLLACVQSINNLLGRSAGKWLCAKKMKFQKLLSTFPLGCLRLRQAACIHKIVFLLFLYVQNKIDSELNTFSCHSTSALRSINISSAQTD